MLLLKFLYANITTQTTPREIKQFIEQNSWNTRVSNVKADGILFCNIQLGFAIDFTRRKVSTKAIIVVNAI
jgi:hypothetical protein